MRIRASICSMQTPFFFDPFFFLLSLRFSFFEEKKRESNQKLTRVAKFDLLIFHLLFFFLVWRNMEIRSLQILTQESKSLKFQRGKRKI